MPTCVNGNKLQNVVIKGFVVLAVAPNCPLRLVQTRRQLDHSVDVFKNLAVVFD